ncbi:hypothetical protein U1Q18_004812, partial [Sarracenia purpurea var. burkii]
LPSGPNLDLDFSNGSCDPPSATNVDNYVECNHELALSLAADVVKHGTDVESRALVAIPAMNAEALAAIPLNQKTRRFELVQRRTMRPFSMSEVEALVEAVEKLGTERVTYEDLGGKKRERVKENGRNALFLIEILDEHVECLL